MIDCAAQPSPEDVGGAHFEHTIDIGDQADAARAVRALRAKVAKRAVVRPTQTSLFATLT